MSLSAEMAAEAASLCEEFGATVTLSGVVGGTYNTTTRRKEGGTPVTLSPKAFTEPKGKWIDGVVKGELKLTFSAQGLANAPEPGMTFEHRGKGYKVMDKGVFSYEVEGVPVLYEVYGVSA